MEKLIEVAKARETAIMCAEAVPWRCHRSLIADALIKKGWIVRDIMTRTITSRHLLTPFLKDKERAAHISRRTFTKTFAFAELEGLTRLLAKVKESISRIVAVCLTQLGLESLCSSKLRINYHRPCPKPEHQ